MYDPRAPGLLRFHDQVARFRSGAETPSAYVERCIERIAAAEPRVKAFSILMLDTARAAAHAATARYAAGKPVSPIDGLPLAIKDIFETRDAPTSWGVAAFKDHTLGRDAAIVRALRVGGAALVGKTHLPELGFGAPPPTVNPWDSHRSPGGSSSGSAAAVGAGMLPLAIGTQGRGSLTRPASYCGVYGFKPTHGAIHRGGDGGGQETNTHIGMLAGALEDAWMVARFLSDEAGPHPGCFGLEGPALPPAPQKPLQLVRIEGAGWAQTNAAARTAYEAQLAAIAATGIAVEQAEERPETRALAADLKAAAQALADIADYESRWPLVMHVQNARAEGIDLVSPVAVERALARADIPRASYHDALRFRAAYQQKLAACRAPGLLLVSPAATGAASADLASTGSSVYQWASSLAGNPVLSLPFMSVENLPYGLQLQGFFGADADLLAHGLWLDGAFRRGEI